MNPDLTPENGEVSLSSDNTISELKKLGVKDPVYMMQKYPGLTLGMFFDAIEKDDPVSELKKLGVQDSIGFMCLWAEKEEQEARKHMKNALKIKMLVGKIVREDLDKLDKFNEVKQ